MYTTLISATQLKQCQSRDTVIFDCRFDLQNPNLGRTQYDEGHIPGAYYLDLNLDMSSRASKSAGRHPLPEFYEFADILAQCGVNKNKQVVCYDASGGCYAARAWWLIKAAGIEQVAVLDGGIQHWCSSGNGLDLREPQPIAGKITAHDWQLPMVSIDEMQQRVSAEDSYIFDAREAARYRGEIEPIDPIAGHIPGAINRPWKDALNEDGLFKSKAQQQERWAGLNNKNQIHYCGSGVTACVNVLSKTIADGEIPTLFVGSWSQWCGNKPDSVERET